MNTKRAVIAVLCVICLMGVMTMYAFASATPDQAVAMVEKAVKYFKEKGAEKAFAEFSNPKGAFVEGELYVFAYDLNGKNVAHGANPAHIGKDLINLTDANGKPIIKEMIDLAKSKGSGWIDYKYKNPKTGEIEPKSSFIEKVGDYFIGCGIYKKG